MTGKGLPRNLTSYDFFKAAAVLLMVVDHLGYYFYDDVSAHSGYNWFRVFGRMCVPVWFFLVGYARSRDLSPRIWIGAAVLEIGSLVAGIAILPLNVLWSMIAIRLVLDPVMRVATRNLRALVGVSAFLFLLVVPSYYVIEYGTQGLILAMFGWMMRHRPVIPGVRDQKAAYRGFALFCIFQFVFFQEFVFLFDQPQLCVLAVGIAAGVMALYRFRPREYPELTAKTPGWIRDGVQFLGRWTLEIYVGHLILFKIIGLVFRPGHFVFMHFHLS